MHTLKIPDKNAECIRSLPAPLLPVASEPFCRPTRHLQATLRADLDACLLNDEEFARYVENAERGQDKDAARPPEYRNPALRFDVGTVVQSWACREVKHCANKSTRWLGCAGRGPPGAGASSGPRPRALAPRVRVRPPPEPHRSIIMGPGRVPARRGLRLDARPGGGARLPCVLPGPFRPCLACGFSVSGRPRATTWATPWPGNECLPGAHACCLPYHAGEEEWDEGRIAPYQVRLWPEGADGSGEYDGMMIFAPVAGWVWHPGEGAGLEETLGSPAHDQYGPRGPPY